MRRIKQIFTNEWYCPLFQNKGEGPNNIWIHLTLLKQQSVIIIFTFYSDKGGDQHLWDMS